MKIRIAGMGTKFALAILLLGTAATYAADANKKERCTLYAQRAVQQYQLMKNHPLCLVKDDLNWHGSVDGHYNGCMLIPEVMARAGEAGRDNHLQACGALADAISAPKAPSAPPYSVQTPSNPASSTGGGGGAPLPAVANSVPGVALPETSPSTSPVPGANGKISADQCQPSAPPKGLVRGSYAGSGQWPRISGDTLSFKDDHGALRSFKVQRPTYWNTYMRCLRNADPQKADMPVMGLTGPWVWMSANGQEADLFDVAGGAINIASIPPSVATELLKN